MKKKLVLNDLNIESFVTGEKIGSIKGGTMSFEPGDRCKKSNHTFLFICQQSDATNCGQSDNNVMCEASGGQTV